MQKLSLEKIINQDISDFKGCHERRSCDNCPKKICVMIVAVAEFPSKFGTFQIIGFVNNKNNEENIAIVKGDIINGEEVLTRVHSACLTGDALGSLRCDCGPQLARALEMIEQEGRGIVLYMQQEGRGIGLLNKLRAYALQDNGYDTYDANIALGFEADLRDYEVASEMLEKLGVKSIRLITNNPEKIKQIEKHFKIIERVPLELPPSKYNLQYYRTKKEKFGHFLEVHVHDLK